jgi:glutaredoxin 2
MKFNHAEKIVIVCLLLALAFVAGVQYERRTAKWEVTVIKR